MLELEFVLPNPGGMLGKGVGIVKFTTRPRKCERTALVCFAWLVFFISPTHKRTEGRAPVWGSEFTSKRRRTTGGDTAETAVG